MKSEIDWQAPGQVMESGGYDDVRAILVFAGERPLVERHYDWSARETSDVYSVSALHPDQAHGCILQQLPR